MDNITVIVEDYPQEITVQVTTTGITVDQANQIIENEQKIAIEKQDRISADNLLQVNVNSEASTRLANDNTIQSNLDTEATTRLNADNLLQGNIDSLDVRVSLNDVKVGITTAQANEIIANNAKVGITPTQSNDIIANNAKVGITTQQASDIVTNNSKVGITTQQASDITTNNAKVSDINHVTIELPNVDNTSDLNKPISTATQSALDLKVDTTKADITTENIFKSVSFAMDFSDRVVADNGAIESRDCVMNEYLKMIN